MGVFKNKKDPIDHSKEESEKIKKELESLNLHSKIDSEFAPKMANTAVGQVLENIG